jgi:hypothetical protein
MKLKLSLLAACLLAAAASASAQTITEVDGKYVISVGQTTMTVDANRGGKILSYKLGEDEVLNQGRMPNSFGSTFWTSPQSEWNWPPVAEYDSKPFQAEIVGDKLVLTGDKSRFGYSIRKEFSADARKNAISITYTIVNESGETRQVAPWEISRVPNDGVLFFVAKAVEPANNMAGMPFEFMQGGAWFVMDEARENRKINADGKGWLAYSAKGLLFVKKFQDLKAGQAAPAEAEIQAYANPGKTFVEIEEQGAYTTLAPGATLSWTVRWSLVRTDLAPVPSKALLKQAKKLAK